METPAEASRFLDLLFGWNRPRRRHTGQGAIRAAVRLSKHSADQSARVAPALPAFAERRAALARKRVKRWQKKHGRDLSKAPGHIKAMSREQRA